MTAQGFSTKYEDHKGLLHMLARRCYARANAAGVVTDYEDVYAEMCVAYTKATKKYDPTRGITFTAYCGRVCWNHFNKVMEKEEASGPKLGLMRLEDMKMGLDDDGGSFGSDDDPLEFLDVESETEKPEDMYDAADETVERKQEFIHKFRQLSPEARMYVARLIDYKKPNSNWKPSQEVRKRIREELKAVYGVTIHKLHI